VVQGSADCDRSAVPNPIIPNADLNNRFVGIYIHDTPPQAGRPYLLVPPLAMSINQLRNISTSLMRYLIIGNIKAANSRCDGSSNKLYSLIAQANEVEGEVLYRFVDF
jgi:hypothetical protein